MTDPLEPTAASDPNQQDRNVHLTQSGDDERTRSDGSHRPAPPGHAFAFLAPPGQPDELGQLGGYRILRVLGRGGMGVVFRAEDPHLRRAVAIKVMLPEVAANPRSAERFLREARAAAAVKHDHIVTIYQVGQDRGVPFIALEYLTGEPLNARIKRLGRLPANEVMRLGHEAALGLAAAHDAGLIHRDIKPGNIWLEAPTGRVKLLDFGLARVEGDATHLTGQNVVMGTPAYMPLEQASDEVVDHRADLFSLGVTLYKAASGAMPFKGDTPLALLTSLAFTDPVPLQQLAPDAPPVLVEVVMKLLARRAADRFPSAHEVAARLAPAASVVTVVVAQTVPAYHAEFDFASGPTQYPSGSTQSYVSEAGPASGEPKLAPHREPAPARTFPRRAALLGGLGCAVVGGLAWAAYRSLQPRAPEPVAPPVVPPPVPPPASGSLDGLNPARIPRSELIPGHPNELVAVFGTRANRHWGKVRAIAASANGKRLATIGGDPFVRIYDRTTFAPVAVVHADKVSPLTSLALSPDGNTLFVGGAARFEVWNITAEPNRVHAIEAPARGLHLSGSGKQLLVHDATAARVYDLAGTVPVQIGPNIEARTLLNKPGTFLHTRLISDGARVALACSDSTIRILDLGSRKQVGELTAQPSLLALSTNRDGTILACQSTVLVRVWDVSDAEPKQLREIKPVNAMTAGPFAVSPDGANVVLVRRGMGYRWATSGDANGTTNFIVDGTALAWTDDKHLVTGGAAQPDFLWTVDLSGMQPVRARPHTGRVSVPLLVTAQGKVLVSDTTDAAAGLAWYDATGAAPQKEADSTIPASGGFALNRGATNLFHAHKELTQYALAGTVARPVRSVGLKAIEPFPEAVAVSASGTVVVTGVSSDPARVWRTAGDKFEAMGELPDAVPPFGLSADGATLVSAGSVLWDLKTLTRRATTKEFVPGKAWATSADGRFLAVRADTGGAVRVWDVSDGGLKFVRELTGPGGSDAALLAFAPDGVALALAGPDKEPRYRLVVWAADGNARHDWPLRAHRSACSSRPTAGTC